MLKQHPDPEVQQAIIHLCDKLCSWERATGRQNLFVVIEQDEDDPFNNRFEFVADCGKPLDDSARLGITPDEFVKIHCEHYASGKP